MNPDVSLVPPDRLGALLTEQRTLAGLTIEELREQTGLDISADDLRRIEQGQISLPDDQIHRLMRAYGADAGAVVPERSGLVIDLHDNALLVGRKTRVLPEDASIDEVLGRYLSLLYLLRGLEPGAQLPLRDDDLEVLSGALEHSIAEVEGRLFELMAPSRATPWFSRVKHRLTVPAAGMFVGVTTVGAVVLVQMPAGVRPSILGGESSATSSDPTGGPDLAISVNELQPPEVPGSTGIDIEAESGHRVMGAAAESLITYPFREVLSGWTFDYTGPRSGYRGNTNTVTRTITVYVSDHDTAESVAEVLAHEIGHAIDVMYLNEVQRQEWMTTRSISGAWWPESGAGDFSVGAGDFAEAVAGYLIGSPSNSSYGPFERVQFDLVQQFLP